MSLQIVRGRSGCGKSRYIIERIKNLPENEKVIVIVPEQFSFAAEKQLVGHLGGTGLNGREVLTFSRLVHRLAPPNSEYIKPAGKQMILYKAVESIKKDNGIFEKSLSKPGFTDMLGNLISEMKRYGIDGAALREKADAMPDGMLKRKLDAILRIYGEYNRLMPDNVLDSEDNLSRLAALIMEKGGFENTHIFIDEFSDFLPQHYSVLESFMYKAKSVTVTLCADDGADMFSMFAPSVKTLYRLKDIAYECDCDVLQDIVLDCQQRFKNAELAFLEREWETEAVYEGTADNISCYEAFDPYGEIEHTAIEIISLVRNKGYRFGDIGILCADMENYAHLIEVVFKDYGIPYFSDKKVPVTAHPIILPILAVFDVFANGFDYASVFSYLRTGYSGVSDDEIDILENYVLENGISGKKAWLGDEEWSIRENGIFDIDSETANTDDDGENVIDSIRRRVSKPFIKFEQSFDGRKTIREICMALFDFLENGICFADNIKERIRRFEENGEMDEAQQYRQIWKILVDVLDQAVRVMGDDVCGMERFYELFGSALSKYEIGIIPSSVDMVSIGNADRSRASETKVLFVIGATYDKLPECNMREGILSDNDRRILSGQGIELAPDTKSQVFDGLFKVYKAVSNASEMLFVSCSSADTSGAPQSPAELITRLKRNFKNVRFESAPLAGGEVSPYLAVLPEPAFAHMIAAASSKECSPVWKKAYEWYEKNDEYRKRLYAINNAKKERTAHLSASTAARLYPENVQYSSSRLERFAECPFKYFVKYGLRAEEREEWKVRSYDIGNLLHRILRLYCERVEALKTDDSYAAIKAAWRSITPEKSDEIINELMEETKSAILKNSARKRGSLKFLMELLENNLRESAKVLLKSVTTGEFAPAAYEKEFDGFKVISVSGNETMLRGTIDRIDLFEVGDRVYIRIVDYKSNDKKLEWANVFGGIGMQLLIYAQAAIELYKKGGLVSKNAKQVQIGAVMYSSLSDELERVDRPIDESEFVKKYKFDGLFLEDAAVLNATDRGFKNISDGDLRVGGATAENAGFKSELFPIEVTAGGALHARNAKTATKEQFDLTGRLINKKIAEIDGQIRNGNIAVYPYSEDKKSCMYCPYKEICCFDEAKHKRRSKKSMLGKDKWEEMRKELSEEEE